jgi:hypothetical protein
VPVLKDNKNGASLSPLGHQLDQHVLFHELTLLILTGHPQELLQTYLSIVEPILKEDAHVTAGFDAAEAIQQLLG